VRLKLKLANDNGAGFDVFCHDGLRTDLRTVANGYVANDDAVRTERNIVADCRVTLNSALKSFATESDSVIHQNIVANICGCADNNTHAVIDKHATTNRGRWMNFDACPET
jgi:hypothetical protein